MPENDYIYAVTRVHAHEQHLLNRQDAEALIAAADTDEVLRLLKEKGWGSPSGADAGAEALLNAETHKTWFLIQELCGDIPAFALFRHGNDFHNLKAAVKLTYTAQTGDTAGFFIPYGNVEVQTILAAAETHDFSALPEALAAAGRAAYEVLAHTGNGQLCDMAIDVAALESIWQAGQAATSELLREYARITVDSANIRAAVRCQRMGKSREFAGRAIADAGTLEKAALVAAADGTFEDICQLLHRSAYADAVEALRVSMASFECWCDNAVMEMIRPQRTNYFGIEPLAAFVLGRENEIRLARLILSAKTNRLESAAVRERLRVTYV